MKRRVYTQAATPPEFRPDHSAKLVHNPETKAMKKTTLGAFALTAAMTVSTAYAGSCPMHMQQIDAAMANSTLSSADMEKVRALRATGEKLHKSGDHSGSVQALGEAREMLGI
jgi:hypothetical protein